MGGIAVVWLGFAAFGACLLIAALHFAAAAQRRVHSARRLDTAAREALPSALHRTTETLQRLAVVRTVARALESRLLAAGVEVSPTAFLGWLLVALVAWVMVLPALGSLTLGLVLLGMGVFGVRLWLNRRVEQRREQLITQLPDMARLLSNAANAGLAMRSGIAMAAREIAEPARSELLHVTELLSIGYPLDEALAAMSRRLPSREVSVLVTTLVVQQRSGGRVITALRNVAATLEVRKDVRREIRTLMAGAVTSAYIVAALGLGSVLLLNLVSPGVFDSMVASPAGRVVLVFSGALYAAGFSLIRRMTRIEP